MFKNGTIFKLEQFELNMAPSTMPWAPKEDRAGSPYQEVHRQNRAQNEKHDKVALLASAGTPCSPQTHNGHTLKHIQMGAESTESVPRQSKCPSSPPLGTSQCANSVLHRRTPQTVMFQNGKHSTSTTLKQPHSKILKIQSSQILSSRANMRHFKCPFIMR